MFDTRNRSNEEPSLNFQISQKAESELKWMNIEGELNVQHSGGAQSCSTFFNFSVGERKATDCLTSVLTPFMKRHNYPLQTPL